MWFEELKQSYLMNITWAEDQNVQYVGPRLLLSWLELKTSPVYLCSPSSLLCTVSAGLSAPTLWKQWVKNDSSKLRPSLRTRQYSHQELRGGKHTKPREVQPGVWDWGDLCSFYLNMMFTACRPQQELKCSNPVSNTLKNSSQTSDFLCFAAESAPVVSQVLRSTWLIAAVKHADSHYHCVKAKWTSPWAGHHKWVFSLKQTLWLMHTVDWNLLYNPYKKLHHFFLFSSFICSNATIFSYAVTMASE